MQQTPVFQDTPSPYMLWQYVHLMTPTKTSDYALHPAFTHTNALTAPHMGYLREQCVGNVNYNHHHHQQQFPLQHPSQKEHHFKTQVLLNDQLQELYHNCPRKMKKHDFKNLEKNNFDRNANLKSVPDQMTSLVGVSSTPRSLSPASPKKGSSFTIDAILSKEQVKSEIEISPPSGPAPSPSNTDSYKIAQSTMCCTSPGSNSCSPSNGHGHGQFITQQPSPNFESNMVDRRHGRFLEVPVSHPYFLQQYDSQQHHLHSPRHSSFLTPSSSSGSSSASSSASTSPENNSCQSIDKTERKTGGKSKRIRTIFTPEQLERLEAEFERQQYMVGTERYYLAASLSLTEAQVKVWFQNRRIKWRKQHLEQQQARLAKGDLYRDLDEDSESETEDNRMSDSINLDTNMNVSRSVEDSMPIS